MALELLFWFCLAIIAYTFVGYGIILFLLVRLKQLFKIRRAAPSVKRPLPTVTLIVAAYNEADVIREKLHNCRRLYYPADKLQFLFVTDGSTDETPDIVRNFQEATLLHQSQRKGKINAIHRAMKEVTTDIVVFTDANTLLNQDAILHLVRHYENPKVGAVSGEKKVISESKADATAGEGFYWKYESALKRWDAALYSVVGAAGELFSIRTAAYRPVPPDTILDDFMLSLQLCTQGYITQYEPRSYALETASENTSEELKRKIRIAAGGIQSIIRLRQLLNPFKYPVLSFQFISHRVLRWTITPVLLLLLPLLNTLLVIRTGSNLYLAILVAQVLFFALALGGFVANRIQIKWKLLFIPYYFCLMNYAVLAGIVRYFSGRQHVTWEKVKRKNSMAPV